MHPDLIFYAPTERWRIIDGDAGGAVVHECTTFGEACELLRQYGREPVTGETTRSDDVEVPTTLPLPEPTGAITTETVETAADALALSPEPPKKSRKRR